MKGRNSSRVSIRLPDDVLAGVKYYLQPGQTVASWIQELVIDSVRTMDSGAKTDDPRVNSVTEGAIHSVRTTKTEGNMDDAHSVRTTTLDSVRTMPDLDHLRQVIKDIAHKVPEPSIIAPIPWYDSSRHTTGDTVRIRKGNKIEVVTL